MYCTYKVYSTLLGLCFHIYDYEGMTENAQSKPNITTSTERNVL